jgi:hypothetical protein
MKIQQKEEGDSWGNKVLAEIVNEFCEYLKFLKIILGITEWQYISRKLKEKE